MGEKKVLVLNIQLSSIDLQLWKKHEHIFHVFSRKQGFHVI